MNGIPLNRRVRVIEKGPVTGQLMTRVTEKEPVTGQIRTRATEKESVAGQLRIRKIPDDERLENAAEGMLSLWRIL